MIFMHMYVCTYNCMYRRDTVCDVCSARHESSEVSCTYTVSQRALNVVDNHSETL